MTTNKADNAESTKIDKLTDKSAAKNTAKARLTDTPTSTQPQKSSSASAIFALFLAIVTLIGATAAGYWFYQQLQQLQLTINQATTQQQAENKAIVSQVRQQLEQQNRKLENSLDAIELANQSMQQQISSAVKQLAQSRQTNFQLDEVGYILKLAARELWLHQDGQKTIRLLTTAKQQVEKLQQPQLLPLQQALTQDIEQLSLLPKVESQNLIMQLRALQKAIEELPIAQVKLPKKSTQEEAKVSDNISDWQQNLAKVWANFQKNFLTVSRRAEPVKPLMAPEFQQNLRENLSLKLQLAQWAVMQNNAQIYQSALADALAWSQRYFDNESMLTSQFNSRLQTLAKQPISVELPQTLTSLTQYNHLTSTQNHDLPQQTESVTKGAQN